MEQNNNFNKNNKKFNHQKHFHNKQKKFENEKSSSEAIDLFNEEIDESLLEDDSKSLLDDNSGFTSKKLAVDDENANNPVDVVGVRFKKVGKVYYFAPGNIKAKKGDFAIVETARGPEFGEVWIGNTVVKARETVEPLKPLIRIATKEDIKHNEDNKLKEAEAFKKCLAEIESHKLDMKLVEAQYTFDNSKLLFYFTSNGRVDFRDLVKDLASIFRTRIELRQIGIRDEAKLLGGLGVCGRSLCCASFLSDFAQVSIKMAKEQGLSLNSTKISGNCGRLMCCLQFEQESYKEEIALTPPVDSVVKTEDGVGVIVEIFPISHKVKVKLDDKPDVQPKIYDRDSVSVIQKK